MIKETSVLSGAGGVVEGRFLKKLVRFDCIRGATGPLIPLSANRLLRELK
jgi:hypothetical protein